MSKNLESRISNHESDLPSDVVLRVDNVSKKFCKKLKQSMKYGIRDLARNLGRVLYIARVFAGEVGSILDVGRGICILIGVGVIDHSEHIIGCFHED